VPPDRRGQIGMTQGAKVMEPCELLDRCEHKDPEAWPELWHLVEDLAAGPVLRLIRCWHLDASLADDVLQEFYIYLQAGDFRRLRVFRGTRQSAWKGFLHAIAMRFTLKMIRRWHRTHQEEMEARHHFFRPDRRGPTEKSIEAVLRELALIMPEHDWAKLQWISGCPELMAEIKAEKSARDQPPALRTIRHWRCELFRKYGDSVS
jgi:DNA-directed RNA polymerase specialized sigma24 family protein